MANFQKRAIFRRLAEMARDARLRNTIDSEDSVIIIRMVCPLAWLNVINSCFKYHMNRISFGLSLILLILCTVPLMAAERGTYSFPSLQGRIAIYRDYNAEQKSMELCATECLRINNESHIVTAETHPYYLDIGKNITDVNLNFEIAPKTSPTIKALSAAQPFSPGFYEDDHPSLVYGGSWLVQHREGPSNNQIHTGAEKNSTLSFDFVGTGFEIGLVRYDDRAQGKMCIDNKCRNIDLFSYDLKWKHPYAVMGLKNGKHHVTYQLKSGKAIDLDWLLVFGPQEVLTDGKYSPTNEFIQRTSIQNEREPTQLAFAFKGKKVALIFSADTDAGDTVICIDGLCTNHDLYSYLPTQKTVLLNSNFNANHRVTITKGNTRYMRLLSINVGAQ